MKSTVEILKKSAENCLTHWKPLLIVSIIFRLILSIITNLIGQIPGYRLWDATFYIMKTVFHSPFVRDGLTPPSILSVSSTIGIFLIQYAIIPVCTTLPIILILNKHKEETKTTFMTGWRDSSGAFVRFTLLWGLSVELFYTLAILYKFIQMATDTDPLVDYSGLFTGINFFLICIIVIFLPMLMFALKITPIVIAAEKRKTYNGFQRSYLLLAQNFFANFWSFVKITLIFFSPHFLLYFLCANLPFYGILSAVVAGVVEPLEMAAYLYLLREFSSQRIFDMRPRLKKLAKKLNK